MSEWNHSVSETRKMHLWMCVDEATKFTVGHVWAQGQQGGNIDGNGVLELLQERWISIFGRMHSLRTDPEGGWSKREVHERLSDMQMVLDLLAWRGIVASVCRRKHHWNCERHDDEKKKSRWRDLT